jgi:hypothetical protein
MTDRTDKTLLELPKLAATPIDRPVDRGRGLAEARKAMRTLGSGQTSRTRETEDSYNRDVQQDAESRGLVLQAKQASSSASEKNWTAAARLSRVSEDGDFSPIQENSSGRAY